APAAMAPTNKPKLAASGHRRFSARRRENKSGPEDNPVGKCTVAMACGWARAVEVPFKILGEELTVAGKGVDELEWLSFSAGDINESPNVVVIGWARHYTDQKPKSANG